MGKEERGKQTQLVTSSVSSDYTHMPLISIQGHSKLSSLVGTDVQDLNFQVADYCSDLRCKGHMMNFFVNCLDRHCSSRHVYMSEACSCTA
jgi:hypothetical protein